MSCIFLYVFLRTSAMKKFLNKVKNYSTSCDKCGLQKRVCTCRIASKINFAAFLKFIWKENFDGAANVYLITPICFSFSSPSYKLFLMRLTDTIHECSCGGKKFQLCQISEMCSFTRSLGFRDFFLLCVLNLLITL